MKLILSTCLLLLAVNAPAQDQFAADSTLGFSGVLCDPWSCTPAPLPAVRGTLLGLAARKSVFAERFLLLSVDAPQCLTLPGIGGALIAHSPAAVIYLPLTWGRMYANVPAGYAACDGWIGFGRLTLPVTVQPGSFTMQTVSISTTGSGSYALNLSNAITVTMY